MSRFANFQQLEMAPAPARAPAAAAVPTGAAAASQSPRSVFVCDSIRAVLFSAAFSTFKKKYFFYFSIDIEQGRGESWLWVRIRGGGNRGFCQTARCFFLSIEFF